MNRISVRTFNNDLLNKLLKICTGHMKFQIMATFQLRFSAIITLGLYISLFLRSFFQKILSCTVSIQEQVWMAGVRYVA